jgi:hypothetical protein
MSPTVTCEIAATTDSKGEQLHQAPPGWRNPAGRASGIVLEDRQRPRLGRRILPLDSYLAKMNAVLIENALGMLRVWDESLANALHRDATLKSCKEVLSQNLQPPEKGAR